MEILSSNATKAEDLLAKSPLSRSLGALKHATTASSRLAVKDEAKIYSTLTPGGAVPASKRIKSDFTTTAEATSQQSNLNSAYGNFSASGPSPYNLIGSSGSGGGNNAPYPDAFHPYYNPYHHQNQNINPYTSPAVASFATHHHHHHNLLQPLQNATSQFNTYGNLSKSETSKNVKSSISPNGSPASPSLLTEEDDNELSDSDSESNDNDDDLGMHS